MYIDLAKEFIETYGILITRIFHESLDTWVQITTVDGCEHKRRTQSSYIWDTFFHKIRLELDGNHDFHFVDTMGTIFMVYKQTFLIKMKKLGKDKHASYIKTDHAERFQRQLDMGLGDLVNIYLYYATDRYNIAIDSIKLQCENGNAILWGFPIDSSLDITTPDIFYGNQETSNNRIRVKETHRKEQQNGKAI
jgi:hypothetical protein